jgi:hypothetical protein
MKTASDVCRTYERHQRFILTHRPRAEALAHIGIQIDSDLSLVWLNFSLRPIFQALGLLNLSIVVKGGLVAKAWLGGLAAKAWLGLIHRLCSISWKV